MTISECRLCHAPAQIAIKQGQATISCHGVSFSGDRDRAAAAWNRYQLEVQDYRPGGNMKTGTVVLLLSLLGQAAFAWDTSKNPDQVPSIGWGVHAGKLPGFVTDYARYTEFAADVRLPVTNYLSFKLDFTQTTVGSGPVGVPSTANRVGGEFRIHLHDLK